MCNLYSHTRNVEAMRKLFAGFSDAGVNMPVQTTIYPDYTAPIIRNDEGGPRLAMTRWGMPSSSDALFNYATTRAEKLRAKNKPVEDFKELLRMEPDGGTTNVRKTTSKHWTRWLGPENRCLVPWNAFAEPDPDGGNAWFAIDESRPTAFFAGIWVSQWESVRKIKTGTETTDLYGFLTTDPNAEVKPIHWKAMPVILRTPEECAAWMTAPWPAVSHLQRPLPDGSLTVLAREVKRGEEQAPGGPIVDLAP